jgi:2-iminobutanoate/2-iminopropanoate deaminase
MSAKTAHTSNVMPAPIGVWSQGVSVRPGRLFFTAFTSRDADGTIVAPNDLVGQTRQILENMKGFLAEVGATMEDVVKLTVYVTDLRGWSDSHAVRREYFPTDPPASCLVQVVSLVDPALMIEMDMIAVLPE